MAPPGESGLHRVRDLVATAKSAEYVKIWWLPTLPFAMVYRYVAALALADASHQRCRRSDLPKAVAPRRALRSDAHRGDAAAAP